MVFTTAYDEFALRAFKENALDYLEKPIDLEELDRAVGKLVHTIGDPEESKRRSEGLQALMNDPASPLSTRVAVPSRDGLVLLRHEDILYLEASDSYTVVHVRDGKRTISSKHIRVFEVNLIPRNSSGYTNPTSSIWSICVASAAAKAIWRCWTTVHWCP